MAKPAKQNDETLFDILSKKINNFLTKNKNVFIISLVVILIIIISSAGIHFVNESSFKKSITLIEELEEEFEQALIDADSSTIQEVGNATVLALEKLTSSNRKSFAVARAHMLCAEVFYNQENWQLAKQSYELAYKIAPNAYTAGLNAFNAAVCAEKLQEIHIAYENYRLALDSNSFTQKPRTLFNLGRIEEERSNLEQAYDFYQELVASYPDDQWALLAKSRLISLAR